MPGFLTYLYYNSEWHLSGNRRIAMNKENPKLSDSYPDGTDNEMRLADAVEPRLPKLEDYVDPHELETATDDALSSRSESILEEPSLEEQWFSQTTPSAFDFFLQSDVIIRLLSLAVVCALVIYMSAKSIQLGMAGGGRIEVIFQLVGRMALWLATIAVTIPWLAVTSVYGLTILKSTAAGEDRVSGWPERPWLEWLPSAWSVIVPLLSTVLPAAYIAYHLAVPMPFAWFYVPGIPYFLFAIVFLSMTNANSLLAPISRNVMRSFRDRPGAWLLFYFESGFLLMTAMSILISCIWLSYVTGWFIAAFSASLTTVATVFLYFRLLGRLTRRINLS